jgi:hypothetical protein
MFSWWRRWQRKTDVATLWPQCLREAGNRDKAKIIFRVHMEMDPAYSDLSPLEREQFLENLP